VFRLALRDSFRRKSAWTVYCLWRLAFFSFVRIRILPRWRDCSWRPRDDPVVESFQEAHFKALGDALGYLAAEKRKEDRRHGPKQPAFTLTRWEAAWVKYWMVEFFCDLFAVYVLGPAFAWSHLHLTAKRGGDPFEVPLLGTTSHPADDARMRTLLFGLETTEFTNLAVSLALIVRNSLAYNLLSVIASR
jgi:hypothetical protein